jgi:iron complex transport system permease protein
MAGRSSDSVLARPDRIVGVARAPFGFLVNLRVVALSIVAALVLVALVAWALTLGSFRLSLGEVVGAFVGAGSADADFVVTTLRLPRVLAAVLVGAALAMSGAIFQGLVRNPLVSPDIIGINAGAAAGAVFWIVTGRSSSLIPLMAFGGALAAAAAIYGLSWRGRISAGRLVLVGIGINAMLSSVTTLLVVRASITDAQRAVLWQAGSVYGSAWDDVRLLTVTLAVLLPVGAVLMWSLRVLQMGDLTAMSVGMSVERTRLALIVTGCALSAFAVAVAGPIGFVALIVPHLARMLAGPMTGGVFVLTAIMGGALLLGADMVGQHALPVTLPVGILTGAVGAPYFLYLLYRNHART